MHNHTRAHIALESQNDAMELVTILSGLNDTYTIENFDGTLRANAKSIIGVMYAMIDYHDQMYLVNETNDASLPLAIDKFRVVG